MIRVACLVFVLLLGSWAVNAAPGDRITLDQYLASLRQEETKRALEVISQAGDESRYWDCLGPKISAGAPFKDADRLTAVIIDAIVACEDRFAMFQTALRTTARKHGFTDDFSDDPKQLEYLVYSLWFEAIQAAHP